MPSPQHCLSPLTSRESCFTFPFTLLILSHWLHPAHFNLIFLPHVPRPSVDESVQLLPCLMQVWKLGTFLPKDQNKQVRVKDHETIGSQAKHKSFEHNIHTRVNSGLPLRTWAGALRPAHRRLHGNKDLWGRGGDSRTLKLGLYYLSADNTQDACHLFPLLSEFWSQDGMRILIFDS